MNFLLYLAIAPIALFSCSQKTTAPTKVVRNDVVVESDNPAPAVPDNKLPACVQNQIDSIKQLRVWNPPAEVHEYMYNGKRVYLFSADCCDKFPSLLDANCEYICAPSGGFTGGGDGNCTDFNAKAKYVRQVWKDDRKRNGK